MGRRRSQSRERHRGCHEQLPGCCIPLRRRRQRGLRGAHGGGGRVGRQAAYAGRLLQRHQHLLPVRVQLVAALGLALQRDRRLGAAGEAASTPPAHPHSQQQTAPADGAAAPRLPPPAQLEPGRPSAHQPQHVRVGLERRLGARRPHH